MVGMVRPPVPWLKKWVFPETICRCQLMTDWAENSMRVGMVMPPVHCAVVEKVFFSSSGVSDIIPV